MPVSLLHYLGDADDVFIRHEVVKQVAHRIDKDKSRRLPSERFVEFLWHESEVKPSLIRMAGDATESFRKDLCITVLAPRTDFRAAANGIPRRVSPFDFGIVSHPVSPAQDYTESRPGC